MVREWVPGDNTWDLIKKLEPHHPLKHPEAWAAFQSGVESIDYGGIPLTDVPGFTKDLATSYKAFGIHNAEMLAALSDAQCQKQLPEAHKYRKAAQHLVEARKASATFKELQDLRAQFDAMKAEMGAANGASTTAIAIDPVKRGPGRPPLSRD